MSNFYGQVDKKYTLSQIKKICDVLGYGKNEVAHILIKETLMAETHMGALRDSIFFAGLGIAQFDKIPFDDVLRGKNLSKWKDIILKELDIDISIVKWEDLRYNTLLSVLSCRLKIN